VLNLIFFFFSCLHYFNTSQKLEIHCEDCGKLNKCAIRLPSEEKKWLEFHNYGMKERAPFVVYADLECVLRKTEDTATSTSSYAYQQHEVSIGYYVRCSYDDTLSAYRFRRDNDCVSWFASQLEDLAYRAKTIFALTGLWISRETTGRNSTVQRTVTSVRVRSRRVMSGHAVTATSPGDIAAQRIKHAT
ncbi:hypothetical protein ALC62_11038, partial [Cyphomyrmex costatus]